MSKMRRFGGRCAQVSKLIYFHIGYLLWSIVSAGAAVITGEWLINRIYFKATGLHFAGALAAFGNILILCCFILILLALTNRLFSAITLGLAIYALLILADILKLVNFDNPVRPTDLQYLADLEVIAKSFVNARSIAITLAICAGILALIAVSWRRGKPALSPCPRIITGIVAAVMLALMFVLPSFSEPRDWLENQGIERPEWWQFEPSASARLNGLLVEWAMSAGDLFFRSPERYSRAEVEHIAQRYVKEAPVQNSPSSDRPANLIILLVESFMDPLDLKVPFTADPIPTFHALGRKFTSGKVVVPVFGGTSANTEFEILTGLSLYFLPDSSCPYRQYLNHDIPSLPRLLRSYGFRTAAVLADPPYLFSRETVLPHLGFDSWNFPEADPKTPRTPDDEFASDQAIIDAIIRTSQGGSPFFILGFTGGTHYPWDYPDYKESSLDLAVPMPEPNHSRLKTYINAEHVADEAIRKMVAYFEKLDQKTVILIMGDHLPPLAEIYDATGFFKKEGMDEIRQRYEVPMVLWSNFPVLKQDFVCSANFLPTKLLQVLGMSPDGIFAISADLYSHFPVFSKYVRTTDGKIFAPQSPQMPYQQLVEDYRLIQYDLLLGKQYALGTTGWGW